MHICGPSAADGDAPGATAPALRSQRAHDCYVKLSMNLWERAARGSSRLRPSPARGALTDDAWAQVGRLRGGRLCRGVSSAMLSDCARAASTPRRKATRSASDMAKFMYHEGSLGHTRLFRSYRRAYNIMRFPVSAQPSPPGPAYTYVTDCTRRGSATHTHSKPTHSRTAHVTRHAHTRTHAHARRHPRTLRHPTRPRGEHALNAGGRTRSRAHAPVAATAARHVQSSVHDGT